MSPVINYQLTVISGNENSNDLSNLSSNQNWGYTMTKNSVAYEKAYQFAIRILKAYQFLTNDKKEFILSKQLLRCGTAVGANIAEANGAISDADFSNKISIVYQECLETKYWLLLFIVH